MKTPLKYSKKQRFENLDGYSLTKVIEPPVKGIWNNIKKFLRPTKKKLKLDKDNPLTWFDGVRGIIPHDGLITDLGSIPKPLRLINCFGKDRYERAYIFHDDAYCYHTCIDAVTGLPEPTTRQKSDINLRDGIIVLGGWKTTADTVYAGVVVGGVIAWNKKR